METDLAYELPSALRVYKDGRVERLRGTATVPPSLDEKTGIQSKDLAISSDSTVSARLYIPRAAMDSRLTLPVLVYFHGGRFINYSAWSPTYHSYLNNLVAEANVIAVSVDYRRAPEHPLPVAYDDSWIALKWVTSHSTGNGPEEWLNSHANLNKVFLVGDSAGANIVHNMSIRLGEKKLEGIEVPGAIMVHPYFWGSEPLPLETTEPEKRSLVERSWNIVRPTNIGCDDLLINPTMDPRLSGLGCKRVLICVAEKDVLRHRGWYYKEVLSNSGWTGVAEVMDAPEHRKLSPSAVVLHPPSISEYIHGIPLFSFDELTSDAEYPLGPTQDELTSDASTAEETEMNMLKIAIANKMARDHNMAEIS